VPFEVPISSRRKYWPSRPMIRACRRDSVRSVSRPPKVDLRYRARYRVGPADHLLAVGHDRDRPARGVLQARSRRCRSRRRRDFRRRLRRRGCGLLLQQRHAHSRSALLLFLVAAQPGRQLAHHPDADLGVLAQQGIERRSVDRKQAAGDLGPRRRAAWASLEHRHLAEEVTGTERREDALVLAQVAHDLDLALVDDEHLGTGSALLDDDRSGGVVAQMRIATGAGAAGLARRFDHIERGL
jgi:hypothetical protein